MKIINGNIVSAYSKRCIGTKVLNRKVFDAYLKKAIENHDFSKEKTVGQAVILIPLTKELRKAIGSGVGKRTKNPQDYVCRLYRGKVHTFLKRKFAAPLKNLRVVVYTREAYLNDPDVLEEPRELKRVKTSNSTHVLVAILASANLNSEVSPYRFVANLAGGNLDYAEGKMSYKALVELAKKVKNFCNDWITVAD